MKRCLFTYEKLQQDERNYSFAGLKNLSKKISSLQIFPYSQKEQIKLVQQMAGKISIQGVQPKFSLVLSEKEQKFQVVEQNGKYILKTQVAEYPNLPENEDLTMHLIQMAGLRVPWHGLLLCEDQSLSYVIRRFDRKGRQKLQVEDFSQLIGASRTTKYQVPIEKIIETIEMYCTFPTLDYLVLFKMIILSYLLGNEDLHLKNLSVIIENGKVQLSPIYDFVNTSILMPDVKEEMALELREKKYGFTREDFVDYLAVQELFIPEKKAEKEISKLLALIPQWQEKIDNSLLPKDQKQAYKKLILQRAKIF
jgi:serine/threonine-protein kinase HipA